MFSELAEAPDIYRVVDCDSPVNLPLLCQLMKFSENVKLTQINPQTKRLKLNNCLTPAEHFNNLLRSFWNERKCCQDSKDSLTDHFVPVRVLLSNYKLKLDHVLKNIFKIRYFVKLIERDIEFEDKLFDSLGLKTYFPRAEQSWVTLQDI